MRFILNNMTKYIYIFLLFLIQFNSFAKNIAKSDSLISVLDSHLEKRTEYDNLKNIEISTIKNDLSHSSTSVELFNVSDKLFKEYLYYNMDTAFYYLEKQIKFLENIEDESYVLKFVMNKIFAFLQTGMYFEAIEQINSINYENLSYIQKSEYLDLSIRVYSALMQNAIFETENIQYKKIVETQRLQLLSLNEHLDNENIFVYSDLLIENKDFEKARLYLQNILENYELTYHQKAISHHLIAKTWSDKEKIKENLIYSAIYDIKASVKEYISLWQLAEMLYDEGDIDRAYRYMITSLQDASISNIRLRSNTISNIYPIIESTYQMKVGKQQKQIFTTLIIISILLLILLFILWILYRHTVNLKAIRKELKDRNENLKELNISLIDNSLIKEKYIGKYMEQSLLYLERADQFRKSIRKKIETSPKNEIIKELTGTNVMTEELNDFLREFDKTFLSLFPTFVEDYNALLLPGERSIPKNSDELDTELRIYALIRLGITDSDKIARFLGYSLSTIYNYRTKARNKYLGDRDLFEEKVKSIGIKST